MTAEENVRRQMQARINAEATERAALEARHGQVWDTEQLRGAFTVHGFGAPVIAVTRKADNVKGSLYFQHSPRFYWGFSAHDGGAA
jgi:hypothetical protein